MRSEEEIEKDWLDLCASGRRRMEVNPRRKKFGDVVKEVFVVEDAGDEGDFVKLVQGIKRANGEDWVRFTYYVKRPGWKRWRLAGQNSLMLALPDARELLRKAEASGIL